MPRGTASRQRAERLWRLAPDWFDALPRHNVLRVPPEAYAEPARAAQKRVEHLLLKLDGRVGLLLAAGHIASAAVAAVLGLPRRPNWNQTVKLGGFVLLCVAHPSGRSFAYNSRTFRDLTAAAIAAAIAEAKRCSSATRVPTAR